jgi:glycerol-3-phosphate dehydrogenase
MGMILGAQQETFFGLAGVGDTFGTCLGPLSRNRKVGYRLAKGESLNSILESMDGVSEGVSTVLALEDLIKTKVRANVYEFKFPIIAGVAQIIRGNITPRFGLNLLMRYPVRDESRGSNAAATVSGGRDTSTSANNGQIPSNIPTHSRSQH